MGEFEICEIVGGRTSNVERRPEAQPNCMERSGINVERRTNATLNFKL